MRASSSRIWTESEAQAWDLVVPKSQTRREVGFLVWAFNSFANREVHQILDLGCGTGRLAIELSSRGYSVTGIDRSVSMLKRAQQNADDRGVRLRLKRTSLEELDVVERFDAAYSVFSVFNYVLTEDRLRRTLGRLRTLIRPGGILVLDMANYAAIFGSYKRVINEEQRGTRWSVRRRITHRVDDTNMLWYHIEANRMTLGGRAKIWSETHVLRMWMFPELREHLLASGFVNVRLFTRMKAGAAEASTHVPRLVVVCIRP